MRAKVKSVKSVKTSVGGSVVLMTEAKMPLANTVSCVPSLLEVLGHDIYIGGQAGGHQRLDVHVLAPYSEADGVQDCQIVWSPVWVSASHESHSGRRACRLNIVLI